MSDVSVKVDFEQCTDKVRLSGSSVGQVWKVQSADESYVIKRGATNYNYLKEARGLKELSLVKGVLVPRVYQASQEQVTLEYFEPVEPTQATWVQAGEQLAKIHRRQVDHWGLNEDNYIGLGEQVNGPQQHFLSMSWGEFYLTTKIKPQWDKTSGEFKRAFDSHWPKLEEAVRALPSFAERPSLLHGDLWNGNLIFTQKGPCFLDPAVHFGQREFDFGIITLFGGFEVSFFKGYDKVFPRQEGFEDRQPLYEIYHLLNHYNLFGSQYFSAVERVLKSL